MYALGLKIDRYMPITSIAYGKGWPWTPLSYTWARHAQPFYALRAGHPINGVMAVLGVRLLGVRPAVIFYPLGHPTPYAHDNPPHQQSVYNLYK
jgi:hypothetical protein